MTRILISSNPYESTISYKILKENKENLTAEWEDIKNSNPDSKLRDDDTGKAFFPFKAKEIVDIIIDEYAARDEKIRLEFEGTNDEYITK